MRFLADENFPGTAVASLTDHGHDVIWVRTVASATSDAEILAWVARENRILLTFDKDFGDIARNVVLPATCGVILFRMPMSPATDVAARLAATIEARQDWSGYFSVIEPGRVRMRKLAQASRWR